MGVDDGTSGRIDGGDLGDLERGRRNPETSQVFELGSLLQNLCSPTFPPSLPQPVLLQKTGGRIFVNLYQVLYKSLSNLQETSIMHLLPLEV